MNKRFFILFFTLITNSIILFSQDISITIYNNNFAFVKEVRSINTNKGKTLFEISDIPDLLDPTSTNLKLNGEILEQNYKYDFATTTSILRKFIEKKVSLIGNNNKVISGILISAEENNLVLMKKEGGLIIIPDFKKYRIDLEELPEGFVTKPTLQFLAEIKKNGKQNIELTYLTKGLSWETEYTAILNNNENSINLKSRVSIKNTSGKTFNKARIKLIAGEPNFANRNNEQFLYLKKSSAPPSENIKREKFFEYHLYNLGRKSTLNNNETKLISFIKAKEIKINKKFTLKLFPDNSYHNATVKLLFDNVKNNKLGNPLPQGRIRIFKQNIGDIEFIGEDYINNVTEGETIVLSLGEAFDLKGKYSVLSEKKIERNVYEKQNIITVKNAKDSSVTVEIPVRFYGDWEILSSDINYKKLDSRTADFILNIKGKSTKTFKFDVRIKN